MHDASSEGLALRPPFGAACGHSGERILRTSVYVDGFNFYYRAFNAKSSRKFKWVDLRKLVASELESFKDVLDPVTSLRLHYFTAPLTSRTDDPDIQVRQEIWLRAVMTLPDTRVHQGFFLRTSKNHECPGCGRKFPKVNYKEKGSDVNLASHLILDAHGDMYDLAVVVSNDADFRVPIKIVRNTFKKPIVVIDPKKGTASAELKDAASYYKKMDRQLLSRCQFPMTLTDAKGDFSKPSTWP